MRSTAALLLTALLVGGCSAGRQHALPTPTGPPERQLRIGLQEYALQLSAPAVLAGAVTIVVTNAGSAPHDVRVRQDGATLGRSRVLSAGQQQTLVVQVPLGSPLALDCTLTGHAEAGMTARLPVVAPGQSSVP